MKMLNKNVKVIDNGIIKVTFPCTTSDGKWIQLGTSDGVKGWLCLNDIRRLEDGREIFEVFEGLCFAG